MHRQPQVLICSNDQDSTLFSSLLSTHSLAITRVTSGEEALAAMRSSLPDVLLINLVNEQPSVVELLQRVRGGSRTFKVYVGLIEDKDGLLELGYTARMPDIVFTRRVARPAEIAAWVLKVCRVTESPTAQGSESSEAPTDKRSPLQPLHDEDDIVEDIDVPGRELY